MIRAGIGDETTVARFELEVRQTARLTHPNTIAVLATASDQPVVLAGTATVRVDPP